METELILQKDHVWWAFGYFIEFVCQLAVEGSFWAYTVLKYVAEYEENDGRGQSAVDQIQQKVEEKNYLRVHNFPTMILIWLYIIIIWYTFSLFISPKSP